MIETIPTDVQRLIQALISQTERGQIAWQPVDDQATGFLHTGKAGSVSIISEDQDGEHPFVVSLLTPEGVRADSWTSFDKSSGEYLPDAPLLESLYAIAKRSALGATSLVAELLKEIDPDNPS
jgi:hypothetical protein